MDILNINLDEINVANLNLFELNCETALLNLEKDYNEFDNVDKNLSTLLNISITGNAFNSSETLNTESAKIIMETYVTTTNSILGFDFFKTDDVTIESAIEDGVKKAWEFIKKFILQMINILKDIGNKIKDIFSKILKSKSVEDAEDMLIITKEISNIKNTFKNTPEEVIEKEINKDLKVEVEVENKKIKSIRIYKRATLRKTIKNEETFDIKEEIQNFTDLYFTENTIYKIPVFMFRPTYAYDADMDFVARIFLYGFGKLEHNDEGVLDSLKFMESIINNLGTDNGSDIKDLKNVPIGPLKADVQKIVQKPIQNFYKDVDIFINTYNTQKDAINKNIEDANTYVVKVNDLLSKCFMDLFKQERNIKTEEDIKKIKDIKYYLSLYKAYSENILSAIGISIKFQLHIINIGLKHKLK